MSDPLVLVAGLGSAGSRHAAILSDMGIRTVTVSRRSGQGDFGAISDAVAQAKPSHAILAGETAAHLTQMRELTEAGFGGPILVEKPLYGWAHDHEERPEELDPEQVCLGYNLRFDPVITRLQQLLQDLNEPVVAARLEVGQYLSDWRRGQNMSESYSASVQAGGGVLRDLSHELDLAALLFGDWIKLSALGGHMSDLEIESDDCWTILSEYQACPILSIHLNYLDRVPLRRIRINATHQTLEADLIGGTVRINDQVEELDRDPLTSYRRQLEAFIGQEQGLCSYDGGMKIMRQIQDIEEAAKNGSWVMNERLGH